MYTRLSGGRQGWAVIGSPPFDPQWAKAKMPHSDTHIHTHRYTHSHRQGYCGETYLLSQLESGVWTMKAAVPQVAGVDYFSLSHQPIQWAQQLQRTAALRSCWFVTLGGNQNLAPSDAVNHRLFRALCSGESSNAQAHTSWCPQRCTLFSFGISNFFYCSSTTVLLDRSSA